MNLKKIYTYSLLAHINNNGTLVSNLIDIFIPLVKNVLSQMSEKSGSKSNSILDIKRYADEIYGLDMPVGTLKSILTKISDEVNDEFQTKFTIYRDNAYIINEYVFVEFQEELDRRVELITTVEKLFVDFCSINNVDVKDNASIFSFIEKNKISLSEYLSHKKKIVDKIDFSIEAKFVEYFKGVPPIYDVIRDIYIGSIISSYVEYKIENVNINIELLLDTNFIVSLLDLNTIESTHSCEKLIEIARSQGFIVTVLIDTIEETKGLLYKKSESYDRSFLLNRINAEDIYNACERRNINKTDLQRVADSLLDTLINKGFNIIYETSKYKGPAKVSHEYNTLKKNRNSDNAALHDATAIYYVRSKRKSRIKDFENVNCWFVNNSNQESNLYKNSNNDFYQPESIKVDELLNILWLSNPSVSKVISNDDFVDIGLTTLISSTIRESLPRTSIIRELDNNIQKYAKDNNAVTDKDILLVAKRISNKKLKNVAELNTIADSDANQFIKRLKEEATLQLEEENEKDEKLKKAISEITDSVKGLQSAKTNYEEHTKAYDSEISKLNESLFLHVDTNTILQDKLKLSRDRNYESDLSIRRFNRKNYLDGEIKKWQIKFWKILFYIFISIIFISAFYFFLLIIRDNISFDQSFRELEMIYNKMNGVFVWLIGLLTAIAIIIHINPSTIKSKRESIDVPSSLQDISRADWDRMNP